MCTSATDVGHMSWQRNATVLWYGLLCPLPQFAYCECEGEPGRDDIMQQAVFEVPVLKEPLIAIRISLNKRLRNIGWFLAFASRSCLLTSEVWSPIIIYPPAPHSWQLSPWRGLNAGATHWLHQSVRNCNIKNNNWYSGSRLFFEYFL